MLSVYRLTLLQLSGRWRLAIMTILGALPVFLSVITMRDGTAMTLIEFENVVLSGFLAGSIAPLVVLAIAAAAFGNELDDRTLANLTLSPVPRWRIALPKLLGTFTVAAPFITISAFLVAYIAFLGDARATVAITVSGLVGVAMYASMFVWLGLVSTQAIGVGLLYIILWEGFFSNYLSGVRMLSIRYYAIALMHAMDERRFATIDHLPALAAVILSTLVIGGFLFLSVRRLRTMDVP